MGFAERRSTGWTRFIICGGVGFAVLCGASARLLAQANTQQGTEVASALPDAPVPVAAEGSALDRAAVLPRASYRPVGMSQPPSDGLTLGDLGLTPAETEGSAQRQAIFDRRTHMLKVHQKLGLITVIPVAAACLSSVGAPPDKGNYSNTASRDLHISLGATAVAMYAATASYAIRAPRVSGEPARGGVKWHKYLIYIHAPGMVLTPILGAMAYNQINSGQKVHGIASAHGGVAVATAASYGAAILAVSWPIHLKF